MILSLDTSTLLGGVALVSPDGRVLAARKGTVTTHSEALLPLIEAVLADAGIRPAGLIAVACGAGPGSFTGLRIGLATAKGLCLGLDLPLLLVSSLQAMALRSPPGALAVPCIDAFKGEVYAGFYRPSPPDAPLAVEPEAVLPPERLAAILAERSRTGAVRLLGNAADRFPSLRVPGVDCTDAGAPDAADVGRLAALRLRRGERDDLGAAVPTYIRPSEAELKGLKH